MSNILVRRAFHMIRLMSENNEVYEIFWKQFGRKLKMAFIEDTESRKCIRNYFTSARKLVHISKEKLDLGDKNVETEQEYGRMCDWIKQHLGDKVEKVQISNCLSTSPCVVCHGKFSWPAIKEALSKAQKYVHGDALAFERATKRVFEINPEHQIIKVLNAAFMCDENDEGALNVIDLLYHTALISSGFRVEGAVFDLPEEIAKELLTKQTPPGNTISKITKLPALQDDGPSNDNYGRFSNRDRGFWGGSRERGGFRGSRGRGGGGGRDFNDGYHGGRSSRSDNSWSQSSSWSLVNVLLN